MSYILAFVLRLTEKHGGKKKKTSVRVGGESQLAHENRIYKKKINNISYTIKVTGYMVGWEGIPSRALSHKDQNIFEVVAHTYSMDTQTLVSRAK